MMLIKTRVQPSAIHGLGLFAVEAVPCGRPIWRFVPGFDQEFSPEAAAALPQTAREHLEWFAFFRKEDGHAVLSGDHACFMNHSPTPNTGMPPQAAESATTVALRAIAAGEEITCNYREFDAEAEGKLGAG